MNAVTNVVVDSYKPYLSVNAIGHQMGKVRETMSLLFSPDPIGHDEV